MASRNLNQSESTTEPLRQRIVNLIETITTSCTRGRHHQSRLDEIDPKIVVSGTRGKSSLTQWLYEILQSRDYNTFAKITGNRPVTEHGGETYDIKRGNRVTLYENERELRKHTPEDAMVVENQAISSYTTRMVNQSFTDARVVVLSNVREDHLSTLGSDRYQVARGLVRAIPAGTHVVNAERDLHLRSYLEEEIHRRGATVSHVTVPEEYESIPGIESIYALNHVLAAIGEAPLTEDSLEAYRDEMRVEWTDLPNGKVYNAAEVNDVQSTEMVRQALLGENEATEETPVTPFLYLRGDRRGRTVSFLHYLNELYEENERAFETVHVGGETTEVFKRKAQFPVEIHNTDVESAGEVLDALLETGYPAFLMGNTVAEFMREFETEIDRRESITQLDVQSQQTVGDTATTITDGGYPREELPGPPVPSPQAENKSDPDGE
ncbi:Mur ligase family protein [Halalkalicoccus subterraneus]|uniref:Mur ligase family protein n=1 Tax=Halalkalicoccus subterraneus TaxID=2675002 RepID=UPI000EFCB58B|nr:Mur ligase family protein [Halalkalicoccus subterraneus]